MRRLHIDRLFGPEALDSFEVLLEALHPLALGGSEGLELHFAIAQTGSEDNPSAGHHIDRGELLGNILRLVERKEDKSRVQPEVGALGGGAGEKRKLLEILKRIRAVMRALGDRGVAQHIGPAYLLHQLPEARLHVLALLELPAQHEPKLHLKPPKAKISISFS